MADAPLRLTLRIIVVPRTLSKDKFGGWAKWLKIDLSGTNNEVVASCPSIVFENFLAYGGGGASTNLSVSCTTGNSMPFHISFRV